MLFFWTWEVSQWFYPDKVKSCKNHGKNGCSADQLSDSYCARCAYLKAEENLFVDTRSVVYHYEHPGSIFPHLVEDKVKGSDCSWFTKMRKIDRLTSVGTSCTYDNMRIIDNKDYYLAQLRVVGLPSVSDLSTLDLHPNFSDNNIGHSYILDFKHELTGHTISSGLFDPMYTRMKDSSVQTAHIKTLDVNPLGSFKQCAFIKKNVGDVMPFGVDKVVLNFDDVSNSVAIYAAVPKVKQLSSEYNWWRLQYDKYVRPYSGQLLVVSICLFVMFFAYWLTTEHAERCRLRFQDFWAVRIEGKPCGPNQVTRSIWSRQKQNDIIKEKINAIVDAPVVNQEKSSLSLVDAVIPAATAVALSAVVSDFEGKADDEGKGLREHRRGYERKLRDQQDFRMKDVDNVRTTRTTFHEDAKTAEREAKQYGAVNILQRNREDVERKDRTREDQHPDFILQKSDKNRMFIFYDITDLKKLKQAEGVAMYPYAKSGADRYGAPKYAKTRAEFDKLRLQGYRPKIVSGHSGSFIIPEGLYKANKIKINEIVKDLTWNMRHRNHQIPIDEDQKLMPLFKGANMIGFGPVVVVGRDGNFSWNPKINTPGGNWNQKVSEAYQEFASGDSYLNPFDYVYGSEGVEQSLTDRSFYSDIPSDEKSADEGNVQELNNYECPEELVFGNCSNRNSCPREHGVGNHTNHDEAAHYPVKVPIDHNCAYPVYFRGEDGDYKVGVCTRLAAGGFITVRHLFYDENDKLRANLSNFSVWDNKTNNYYPILRFLCDVAIEPSDVRLYDNFKGCRMDYCRFRCDHEFEVLTSKYGVSPNIINPAHCESVRMLMYNESKDQITLDSGRLRAIQRNQVSYSDINTAYGDSGSPVFDAMGRFIAMHQQGGDKCNIGITFSVDGYIPMWFVSGIADLNYHTPCIQ